MLTDNKFSDRGLLTRDLISDSGLFGHTGQRKFDFISKIVKPIFGNLLVEIISSRSSNTIFPLIQTLSPSDDVINNTSLQMKSLVSKQLTSILHVSHFLFSKINEQT